MIQRSDYAQKKHAKMNRIRGKKLALPTLSALREQRLRLQEQIRENRRARHKAIRNRLMHLLHPQKPADTPDKADQEEENNHVRK